MGKIYSGHGFGKINVGYCENGNIYNQYGEHIGVYENGIIYNQYHRFAGREQLGSYSNGCIYNSSGEHIASYEDGLVYNKYLRFAGREQLGSYDDNPAEAAALVLLFLGGNAVNSDDENEDNPKSRPSSTSSVDDNFHTGTSTSATVGGNSDTGFFSALIYYICLVIGALFRYVIFPVLKVYFLAFWLPSVAQMTWVTFAMFLLCTTVFSFAGVVAFYIVAILVGILYIAFIPYWAILMWQKIRKHMTWKEVCSYYIKWFLKGPFAYLDLTKKLNDNNSIPRIAGLLNKIIDWFKNVFKKKSNS